MSAEIVNSAPTNETIIPSGKVGGDTSSSSSSGATAAETQSPVEGKNEARFSRKEVDPETTIFVGNLASECTEQDLKDVFGNEVDIEIPSNKSTRKYKQRYAFVKFPSKIDAESLKQEYGETIVKGNVIMIKKGLTKEQRNQQKYQSKTGHYNGGFRKSASNSNTYTNGSSNGNGGRRMNKKYHDQAASSPPRKERVPLEEMERSTDTLYVNNVSYYATKEDIATFFETTPDLIVLPMRRMKNKTTNRSFYSKNLNRGIAFVSFEGLKNDNNDTTEINKKVTQFQGKSFMDRVIAVDVAAIKQAIPQEDFQDPQNPANTESSCDGNATAIGPAKSESNK